MRQAVQDRIEPVKLNHSPPQISPWKVCTLTPEIIELEDGLVLRPATIDDAEKVANFNEAVQTDPPDFEPAVTISAWIRDLFDGVHGKVGPSDFTVVEDTNTGEIVSSLVLISQTWNIGGIDTPTGMPELVSTHPDYRRRGLVRRQFDLVHEWSKARGELFTTVMGIPNFYKQFGYEYAIDAWGGSATFPHALTGLLEGKDVKPPFTARDAERNDVPFVTETQKTIRDRVFISATRDVDIFEGEMFGRREANEVSFRTRILEVENKPVGYYEFHMDPKRTVLRIDSFEIDPSVNWLDASISLLTDLKELVKRFHPEGKQECEKIDFEIGPKHPLYRVFDMQLGALKKPYAWVVRVPDLAKLVSHLAPLFERRLANSVLRGWSGDLKLSFYTAGLQMTFENGRLKTAANTGAIENHEASARYPGLTFTKALFAQHSFSQLDEMYTDCSAKNRAMATLQDILFGGPLVSEILPVN